MTPPATRAASFRGAQPSGASEEVRRAFADTQQKGTKKKGALADAPRPGALPGSATVVGEVPLASGTGTVEDRCYNSRHALETATGRGIRAIAKQPNSDGRATVAPTEADHDPRLDHLAILLDQFREGQHGLSIRAVERSLKLAPSPATSPPSPLGFIPWSSNSHYNHQRDLSKAPQGGAGMPAPNHPNSLHHQRDLSQAPQRGAGTPVLRHQQSLKTSCPLMHSTVQLT